MKKSKIISSEILSKGFLKVEKLELETPLFSGNGTITQIREVAKQNDSVFILPYDKLTNEAIVVKQHRPGAIYQDTSLVLEPIAGRIDYKSTPEEIAINEAQEESGLLLSPDKITSLGVYMSSPGASTELCHLFLVECDLSSLPLVSHHGLAEEGEDIESLKLSLDEISSYPSLKSIQLGMLINCARMNVS